MEIDILRLIVTNIPNFIGFGLLALIQREQTAALREDNREMLKALRDCYAHGDDND